MDHVVYTGWLRDATRKHYNSFGLDRDFFIAREEYFVVRRRKTEHVKPCFLNDKVLISTWISELGRKAVRRQHRIYKLDEQENLVNVCIAQNLSVYVDKDVAPTIIPDAVSSKLIVRTDRDFELYLNAVDLANYPDDIK